MIRLLSRLVDACLDRDEAARRAAARAGAAWAAGDPEAALEECLAALAAWERADPDEAAGEAASRADLERLAGGAALAAGRHDEAADRLGAALRARPSDPLARYALALVYAARGEHEDALVGAEHALALDPGLAAARLAKGEALAALGRFDAAARTLEPLAGDGGRRPPASPGSDDPLARLLPGPAEIADRARRALARALYALGDLPRAARAIESALDDGGEDADSLFLAGSMKLGEGDAEGAEAAFRRAVALDSRHADAHLALARLLHLTEGDPREAARHFEAAVALREDPDALRSAARFHAERGDPFRALALAERVCAVAPEDPAALAELAARRLALGLYRPARQTLEEYFRRIDRRSLAGDPDHGAAAGLPTALGARAELLAVENRLEEALETLAPALSAPDPPPALADLAATLRRRARRLSYVLAVPELREGAVHRLALARCRGDEIDLSAVLGPDDIAAPAEAPERLPGLEEILGSGLPFVILAVHPRDGEVKRIVSAMRPVETFWNAVELELFLDPGGAAEESEAFVARAGETDLSDAAAVAAALSAVNRRFLARCAEAARLEGLPHRLEKLGVRKWPLTSLFLELHGERAADLAAFLGPAALEGARPAKKKRTPLTARDERLFDDPAEAAAALAGAGGGRALLAADDTRRAIHLAALALLAGREGRVVVAAPEGFDATGFLELVERAAAAPVETADLTGEEVAACRRRLEARGRRPLDERERVLYALRHAAAGTGEPPASAAARLEAYARTVSGDAERAGRLIRETSRSESFCAGEACPAAGDCPARALARAAERARLVVAPPSRALALATSADATLLCAGVHAYALALEPPDRLLADDRSVADLADTLRRLPGDDGAEPLARRLDAAADALARDLARLHPATPEAAPRGPALSLHFLARSLLAPLDLLARRFERLAERAFSGAAVLRDLAAQAGRRLEEEAARLAAALAEGFDAAARARHDPEAAARLTLEIGPGGAFCLRRRDAAPPDRPARVVVVAGPADRHALAALGDEAPEELARLPHVALGAPSAGPRFAFIPPRTGGPPPVDLARLADRLGVASRLRTRAGEGEQRAALLLSLASLVELSRMAGGEALAVAAEVERLEPALADYERPETPDAAPAANRQSAAELRPLALALLGDADAAAVALDALERIADGSAGASVHLQAASGRSADILGAAAAYLLARARGGAAALSVAPSRARRAETRDRLAEFGLLLPNLFLRFASPAEVESAGPALLHVASVHRALPECDGFRLALERFLRRAPEPPGARRILTSPLLAEGTAARLPLAERSRTVALPSSLDLALEHAPAATATERAAALARLAGRDLKRLVVAAAPAEVAAVVAALRSRNIPAAPAGEAEDACARAVVLARPDPDRPCGPAGRIALAGMPLSALRFLELVDAALPRPGAHVTRLADAARPPRFVFSPADALVATAFLTALGPDVRTLNTPDLAALPVFPPGPADEPERALAALAAARRIEYRGRLNLRLEYRLRRVDAGALPDDEREVLVRLRDAGLAGALPADTLVDAAPAADDVAVRALFRLARRGVVDFDDRFDVECLADPSRLPESAEREREGKAAVVAALMAADGFADGFDFDFAMADLDERGVPWFAEMLDLASRGYLLIARDGGVCRVRRLCDPRDLKGAPERCVTFRRRLAEILRVKAANGGGFTFTMREVADRFAHATGTAADPLETKRALVRFAREGLLRFSPPPALALAALDLRVEPSPPASAEVVFSAAPDDAAAAAALPEGDLNGWATALRPPAR